MGYSRYYWLQQLRTLFFQGGLGNKPKPPGYLKGDKLFKVVYPNSGGLKPKITDGMIRFSLGNTVKRWFNIGEFFLPMPTNIDISKVKEFTILPKNGAFYLEISYEIEKETHILDINQALSIDLGTSSNLAACVDTQANSFLVDAREIKAMNQLWNKPSQGSYLDGDSLPVYGEKPDGWKASGSRTKRGLYRCADKSLVNADLNGSANILTKVAGNLGIDLGRLGRRTLTTVARLPLWELVSKTQA